MSHLYDGDVIEKAGRRFRVNIEDDIDSGPPWEDSDGHGVVSDWTTRDKKPGERVLSSDRSSRRYYDIEASLKIAKKDFWGISAEGKEKLSGKLGRAPTAKEIAVQAVEDDFEHLRRWCADQWHYVGVVVTDITEKEFAEIDYGHALWGIESDSDDYLREVADDLIDGILRELDAEAAAEQREADEVLYWASRDVPTAQAWVP